MITVVILGLLAIFFAWLEGRGILQRGLKLSFGLIFVFLALRYNYGSDYPSYIALSEDLKTYGSDFLTYNYRNIEIGWILFNWLCLPIGFFGMIIIISFFNSVIFYKFFKKFVPPNYYWLAIFLYVFNASYMLIHSTAMRQHIALLFFIISLNYLYNKKILKYLICIYLGSLFHYSSLILLTLFVLGFINLKINFKKGFIIAVTYILLFIFTNVIFKQSQWIINQYFEHYTIYYKYYNTATELGSGFGLLLISFFFLIIVYFSKYQNKEVSLLFIIGMLSFLIIPISFPLQIIGRIGVYFEPSLLIIYPIIISQIKKPILKYIFIFLLLFITLYNFVLFFESPMWKSFRIYQTIFSAPQWY